MMVSFSKGRWFDLRFVRGQGPAATTRGPLTIRHGLAGLKDVRPIDVGVFVGGVVAGVGEREGVEVEGRLLGDEETAAVPLPVSGTLSAHGSIEFHRVGAQNDGGPGGRIQPAPIAVAARSCRGEVKPRTGFRARPARGRI